MLQLLINYSFSYFIKPLQTIATRSTCRSRHLSENTRFEGLLKFPTIKANFSFPKTFFYFWLTLYFCTNPNHFVLIIIFYEFWKCCDIYSFPDHMGIRTHMVRPHGYTHFGLTFIMYCFFKKKARIRNRSDFILKYFKLKAKRKQWNCNISHNALLYMYM